MSELKEMTAIELIRTLSAMCLPDDCNDLSETSNAIYKENKIIEQELSKHDDL